VFLLFVHHGTHHALLHVLGKPLQVHVIGVGGLHGRLGLGGRAGIVSLCGGRVVVILPSVSVGISIGIGTVGIGTVVLVIIIVVIAADGSLHLGPQTLCVLLQECILVIVVPVGRHKLLR